MIDKTAFIDKITEVFSFGNRVPSNTVLNASEPSSLVLLTLILASILSWIIMLRGAASSLFTANDDGDDGEPEESYENPELISEIRGVASPEQLMEIVSRELGNDRQLCGEENNSLLAKASSFESRICRHDWADIYYVSGEDSFLEQVAQEKAGRVLAEEF